MPYLVLDPTTAATAPTTVIGAPLTSYGKTLDSMSSELLARLGGRADIDASRITGWINDAYTSLAANLTIEELKSSIALPLVVDQPLYLLPECILTTISVANIDTTDFPTYGGNELEKKDLDWFLKEPMWSGYPTSFFKQGQMLVIYPTPDDTYGLAVNFWIRPADLVATTDSPIFGREWHEAVLLGARYRAHSALLEWDMAQLAENEFINFVRRMPDKTAQEKTGQVGRVRIIRRLSQLQRSLTLSDRMYDALR